MKFIEGTVYTKEMLRLVSALEASGLVVHEVCYDGRRILKARMTKGRAYLYDLFNRVKIRTLVNDEMVGTLMETLHSFGECKLSIINEEQMACA